MENFRDFIIEDICFDVEHNAFWLPDWGEKPRDARLIREIVSEHLGNAPSLTPPYAHRGIPNEPLAAGNPVFSAMQTDIIIYGRDLADYLRREFGREPANPADGETPARPIRFWTLMLDPPGSGEE